MPARRLEAPELNEPRQLSAQNRQEAAFLRHMLASMDDGMHSMAQPLTILQARLEATLLAGFGEADPRELISTLAVDVERLCGLFRSMQQLLAVRDSEAHCTVTPLAALLQPVVDGVQVLFDEENLLLQVVSPIPLQDVPDLYIESQWTRQALTSVLLVAESLAAHGDRIDVHVAPSHRSVEITVENHACQQGILNGASQLSMALAQANIESQNGVFTRCLEPFRVSMVLPLVPA